jgi:hypothetical protein
MSVKIMGLVWDLDISVIDREEKYVLLAYADHADHSGGNIYPSIDLICQKTGYKERAIQMITRSLVKKGFLVPDGKGPKGTNKWKYGGGAENAGVQNIQGAKRKGKGGAKANAPESSEPSLIKQSLELFKGYLGKFLSEKEAKRWEVIYEAIGSDKAEEILQWAHDKEIHLMNRSGLMGSLETAAKKWRGKETPAPDTTPRPEYQPIPEDPNRGKYVPRPSHIRPHIHQAAPTGD